MKLKNDIELGQKNQAPEPTASQLLIQGLRNKDTRPDFSYETQARLLETEEVVSMSRNILNNHEIIYLKCEPTLQKKLGREARLTSSEYVAAIHRFLKEEESEWEDQTMQDMIMGTREYIIAESIIKYARQEGIVEIDAGMASMYTIQREKRYSEGKQFIGEAIIVALQKPMGL